MSSIDTWSSRIQYHVQFLRKIHSNPHLFEGTHLPDMVRDYQLMMPLVAKYGSQRVWLPLHVSWIFHVHLLHPIEYMLDVSKHFGHLVLYNPKAHELDSADTLALFQSFYGTSFDERHKLVPVFIPSKDLVQAAKNQETFTSQVMRFPEQLNIEQCVKNYYKFMACIKKALQMDSDAPHTFVPTLEIDLVWHTNMRYPNEYLNFVKKETGYLLNHEDDNPDLEQEFKETAAFWENEYHEKYTGEQSQKAKCCSAPMQEKAKCCSAPMQEKAKCCSAPMQEKAKCCSAPMQEKAKCCSAPMQEKAKCCSAPMQEKAKCCSAPMQEKAKCCSAPMQEKAKCCSAPMQEKSKCCSAPMQEKAKCCSAPMQEKAKCCSTQNNGTCTVVAVKETDIPFVREIVVY